MSVTIACPDAASLERYSLGQGSEDEIGRLEAHVVQCQACVHTLISLHPRDTVLDALAAGTPGHVADDKELIRVVIDRIKTRMLASAESREGGTPTTTGDAPTDDQSLTLDFLAPPEQLDEIGRLGGYRVLRLIGQGGMGLVFQAEDVQLRRRVALKVMRPRLAQKQASRERFLREAQAAAAIEHDHIVAIHQVGEANGVPYLAMPWLKGTSLDERLQQTPPLSIAETLHVGQQIAAGLTAAHARGLIHRDIKPGNLFLVASDQWLVASGEDNASGLATGHWPLATARVKILDFGLAKPLENTGDLHITQSGAILGTPLYMAPEQARGETVDGRSDLFSLGVVLYRMATGRLPFQGATTGAVLMALASVAPESPRRLNPEVPVGLSELIEQLLAKDPARRPGSARAVSQRLAALQEAVKAPMPAAGATTIDDRSSTRPAPRKRHRLLVAAAVMMLLVGGGAFGVYQLTFATPQGTLEVRIDDPAIEARFKEGVLKLYGPDDKLLYTIKASERNKTLPAGKYKIEIADANGLTLDTDKLTLTKNAKETVHVLLKAPPDVAAKNTPDDEWIKEVAALLPAKQVEAVTAKLRERNPGFAGQVRLDRVEGGVVTEVSIVGTKQFPERDESLTKLGPVQALTGLKRLSFNYTAVSDLNPLRTLRLTSLECAFTRVADLTPLKDMPLTRLTCTHTQVDDLSSLKAMPLTWLDCQTTPVTDLSPLKGLPLIHLDCGITAVSDLSPLAGMPLKQLDCRQTRVTDLSPLKDTPLQVLACDWKLERDLDFLLSLKTLHLVNETPVSQLREEMDLAKGPFDEWLKKVATRPPQKQVRAVAGRLRLDNPARVELLKVEGGVVTAIKISGPKVSDLTPVRALVGLKALDFSSTPVSDLSPLKDMKLTSLECGGAPVSDLSPLKGMPLSKLACQATRVSDLSPLKDMPLRSLWCNETRVSDLSPLKGMPLKELYCNMTNVSELAALAGMPLTVIDISNTRVSDLSPLWGMPLREINCNFNAERDTDILRSIKTLKTIDGKSAAVVLKTVPPVAAPARPLDEAWFKEVAAMPPKQQVEAVIAKLKERNPGFDGAARHQIDAGVVTELRADHVTDISPLRALQGLQSLYCDTSHFGVGVADLSPLKGMKLKVLSCQGMNSVDLSPLAGMPLTSLNLFLARVSDLTPLKGMKLKSLRVDRAGVSDLSPLKGMPLVDLNCNASQVSDLLPLVGMPLETLACAETSVSDLSPLKGMRLRTLYLDKTKVKDLSPLAGMPLEHLRFNGTNVSDLSPVAGMQTLSRLDCAFTQVADLSPLRNRNLQILLCNNTRVADLSALRNMPLQLLQCENTSVTDLSPLKEMPLVDLQCDFKAERDAEILRSIKTLKTINGRPAAEVLKQADARMPLEEAWFKEVAAMPAKQQVVAVIAKLKERNPGFDGKIKHEIEGGAVRDLKIVSDQLTDIAPVRALTGLQTLHCSGANLADLSPLKGMRLKSLDCRFTRVSDLAPLKDMPLLTSLVCDGAAVSDLSPLAGLAAPPNSWPMHDTPVSLLERLRHPDDEAAWQRFVQLYVPLLYHWARRRMVLQSQDAADLVQARLGSGAPGGHLARPA